MIRVAQLATEMKHRSKWEAARLLEALRVMEENAQKKVRNKPAVPVKEVPGCSRNSWYYL